MDLKKILILNLFLLLSFLQVHSLNICGLNFEGEGAEFVRNGNTLFYLDGNGNMFFQGKPDSSASGNTLQWFDDSEELIFGTSKSKFSISSSPSIPILQSTFYRNGQAIASFGKDGTIAIKGKYVYENMGKEDETLETTCNSDGKFYCATTNGRVGNEYTVETSNSYGSSDDPVVYAETRDYFCDITGNKEGTCTYKVTGSQNCYSIIKPYHTCRDNYWQSRGPGCSGGSCDDILYSREYCGISECLIESTYYYDCSYESCPACPEGAEDCGACTIVPKTCSGPYCSYSVTKYCNNGCKSDYTTHLPPE